MLLNKDGQHLTIDGTVFTVGAKILGTDESEYEGLFGFILEIMDGEDKDTENEGVDFACEFCPPTEPDMIAQIEKRFSSLYGEPKKINDICLDYTIMSAEMIRPFKRCRIYQLKLGETKGASAFVSAGLDIKSTQPTAPASLYELVYDGGLFTDSLEDIFTAFNINHPEGYCGRSLSVSDIVELYDAGEKKFYRCNVCGFEEISFDPVQMKRGEGHV